MNKVVWDKQTGGVLLQSLVTKETLGVSPRPVFYEELDLLGLDKAGWKYPRCQEPLMWSCNKQYFYRGDLLFEAKGANIYDSATVVLAEGVQPMKLKPVDMTRMLEKNREAMFLLESEAIEFIRDTYETYTRATKAHDQNVVDYEQLAERQQKKTKQKMAVIKEDCDSFDVMPLEEAEVKGRKVLHTTKVDLFLASFSGGKDSQVVLDLCTRALPPSAFQVIYSDTGYELPSSLELYERVKEYYGKLYPDLKFSTARNHESVLNYWDKIGTPSDKHRWCCSVMKTAPLYRTLKVPGTNRQAKVLAFEGVRAEESAKRSSYDRIGRGVKHSFVINARPILTWTTTDIFLYMFIHGLSINQAYRNGKPRVGCILCPFSSPWDDMIANTCYQKDLSPFLTKIEEEAKQRKIPNLDYYIKERKWGLRASGNFMKADSSVKFKQVGHDLIATITNAKSSLTTWIKAIGKVSLTVQGKKQIGEFLYGDNVYQFSIVEKEKNIIVFTLHNATDVFLIKHIKRILQKTTFCIQCEVCEIECPTGALSVYPRVEIKEDLCIHCHKCLDFHSNGCIVADSLSTSMETKNIKGSISKYGTFGIHESWVDEYFADPEGFWENNALGNKQVDSFKAWLKDAEILDSKNTITPLGRFLSERYMDNHDVVWEIIWTNFCHNSILVNWFIRTITAGKGFDSKILSELALDEFAGNFSENTIKYAIQGFIQVFNYSPIGEVMHQGDLSSNKVYIRGEHSEISEIGLAYSLYKYGNANKITSFRVTDLYSDETSNGPSKEFGLNRALLEKLLRTLNSNSNRIVIAELNMGLDHITLQDMQAFDVLKKLM